MKKQCLLALLLINLVFTVVGQGYNNPVIPGFYPDPSVCRVGDDYYLVNSSFQYFPAVPIHHSKDLIHWEKIGYCIDRPSQIPLHKIGSWHGIYAPSIRYNEGMFYMVTTVLHIPKGGHFYMYTDKPDGSWSDPVWVDQAGIDPDLFFDDDGKCYFISSDNNILACEIDIKTGKKLTPSKSIWMGTGGRYPEAPHIYKKDGYYYLLIAEGGTEFGHMVTIGRSKSVYGPYESNPENPILTHRGISGAFSPIQGTGHADFIQAHDGSWWTVFLAFRPHSHGHHLTGRETYLAPVEWEEGKWPVINKNGTVSLKMDCPTLPQVLKPILPERDNFEGVKLGLDWNYLCIPQFENYSLSERDGYLRLKASTISLDKQDSPTFVGRRQQHNAFMATTLMDIDGLKDGAEAGITTYMINDSHYDLKVVENNGNKLLRLTYRLKNLIHTEKEIPLNTNRVYLRVEGEFDFYHYYYSIDGQNFEKLARINSRYISTETAGGFTGIMLGLFAQTSVDNGSYADFDWFEYKPVISK